MASDGGEYWTHRKCLLGGGIVFNAKRQIELVGPFAKFFHRFPAVYSQRHFRRGCVVDLLVLRVKLFSALHSSYMHLNQYSTAS